MTKLTWMLGAALLTGSFAAAAEAQECESDDDCARGTWCQGEGGKDIAIGAPACDGPDCPVVDPAPEIKRTCQALPIGVCEGQSDCADGLKCVIPTYSSGCDDRPTAVDGGAAEPAPAPADTSTNKQNCTPTEVTSRYGYCELEPQACKTDSECLEGLSCEEEEGGAGSSGSSGGNVGTTEPAIPTSPSGINKQAGSFCGFRVESCESDSDCAADYDCTSVVVGGQCSSSGGTAGVACPSDGPCDEPVDPEPTPREPECTDIVEKQCVPSEISCSVDQNCPTNWKCVTFGEGGLPAPEPWKIEGSAQRCLPEGLALYLQSQGGGVGRDGATNDLGEGAPTSAGGEEDGAKQVPATGNGKSTCSVGLAPRGGESGLLLLLGALAWVGRRRRAA